ncbi:LINE-1 reverse transcriptase like, partial [Trifolium medium]|nr:LINE-1 reverse transcriptase like [Trifolium medium]
MPVKVWKDVVKLQRNFLWGGLAKRRKISWVKWDDVCKPKIEGGLGIRDLRVVNKSLLAKWRWRLLMDEDEVWKDVIIAKYGHQAVGSVSFENVAFGSLGSPWWGDLCKLDSGVGWFRQVVSKKVGRGNSTLFWKEVWVGDQPLEQRFKRLFDISLQQLDNIKDVGGRMNGEWRWNFRWRRHFFVWEDDLFREFEDVLRNVVITEDDDTWIWRPNVDEGFSVKSLYVFLDQLLKPRNMVTQSEVFAFRSIWKSAVPSKVSALAWQVFLNRLPTKDNLYRRGIIRLTEGGCPLCGGVVETTNHLFLHCEFAAAVW